MARRRNYAAEYRERNRRARERGFNSYGQERRFVRRPRSIDELTDLPVRARDVRSDVVQVLALARAEHISPEEAAGRLGVKMSAVSWWGSEALGETKGGRTELTRRDLLQLRPVIFEEGVEFVAKRGWKRREVEEIFRIQWAAAHGMATADELEWLRGRQVGGRPVADTQERLHELARRGEIDPMEVYRGLVA